MKELIFITGASGNLGYEIFKNFQKKYKIIGTYYKNKKRLLYKLDLSNLKDTKKFLKNRKPDIVLHLSAFTNPSLNEKFKNKSKRYNVNTTKNLINSISNKTKFIFFSTDKVYFYKKNKKIYSENSFCKSNLTYAKNKIICENMIRRKFKEHVILRLPIIHSNGNKNNFSFLDNCMINLKRKKKVTVFSDTFRSFVDIKQLIELLKKLLKSNVKGTYNIGSKKFSYYTRLKLICKKLKINYRGLLISSTSNLKDKHLALSTKKLCKRLSFTFY